MKDLYITFNRDSIILCSGKRYITCRRKSDGAESLYDTEEDRFIEYKVAAPIRLPEEYYCTSGEYKDENS